MSVQVRAGLAGHRCLGGFVLARLKGFDEWKTLPEGLRFLDEEMLDTLFLFSKDLQKREVPVNRLDNQVLVRLYEQNWREMTQR